MACTSDDDGASPTTTVAGTTTTASATTTTGGPIVPARVTLGVLVPGAGLLDELYSAQERGLGFARDDIATGGGELTLAFEEAPPGGSEVDVVDDLVGKGPKSIVGPAGSSPALAIQPDLAKLDAVACTASATVSGLTLNQARHLFRTVISDDDGQPVADRIIAKRAADAGAGWHALCPLRRLHAARNSWLPAPTAEGLAPPQRYLFTVISTTTRR
jgi:ABC-type branched-subunit amino acid transport system substrate-binding protein